MKLSDQAIAAVMLALQKSLVELHKGNEQGADMTNILRDFDLQLTGDGLVVRNPPVVDMGDLAGDVGEVVSVEDAFMGKTAEEAVDLAEKLQLVPVWLTDDEFVEEEGSIGLRLDENGLVCEVR